MSKIIKGISFGSVCEMQLDNLGKLEREWKCIELPAISMKTMKQIVSRYCTGDTEYSVHYPSQYTYAKLGFDLREYNRRKAIFRDFIYYVESCKDAAYYLLHFPGFSPDDDEIDALVSYLNELRCMLGSDYKKIVIENLSNCSVDVYKKVLDATGVGLCLDIGHAHMRDSDEIGRFCELMIHNIKVIHYYNTINDCKDVNFGKHLSPYFYHESGIDMCDVNKKIKSIEQKVYLINEQMGINTVNEFLTSDW